MSILGRMSPKEYTEYQTRIVEDHLEFREVGSREWTRLMSYQDEAHDQYFKTKQLAEENARLNIVVTNLKTVVSINQAENAKLRECVEFYADRFSWTESEHPTHEYYAGSIRNDDSLVEYTEADGDVFKDFCGGKRARQVLKELESEYEKTQSEKLVDDLNAYAKQALKELDAKKGLREH